MTWYTPSIDFTASPKLIEFLESDAFFRGVQGPRGAGKSTACCSEILSIALQQPASAKDGYKYSRHAIIRNTSPELKSTTIKTWEALFPPEFTNIPIRWQSPINWRWILPRRGGDDGIHCEVLFVPLDKPKDVRKLLSMELTTAYVNEACEVPQTIIDNLTATVGRYPSPIHAGGTQFAFIEADTNPPDDEENWWNRTMVQGDGRSEKDPLRWRFYVQPPAVIECVQLANGTFESIEPGYLNIKFDHAISAAQSWWAINPHAENLANLRGGGYQYYEQMLTNKSRGWIQRYAQGKCVYVQDGKPVVPEFHQASMVRTIPLLKDEPLFAGIDIGGGTLNPAAVFCQRHSRGNLLVLRELVCPDFGLERFCTAFSAALATHFPGQTLKVAWVDPASIGRDELYEVAVLDHLRSRGIPAMPAPTNDPSRRREALAAPMNRNIDGVPGFLVDPACRQLIAALSGKWKFKRLQVAGSEAKYADKPEKSHPWSDIGDAASYAAGGSGEDQMLRIGQQAGIQPGMGKAQAPFIAETGFNVFG